MIPTKPNSPFLTCVPLWQFPGGVMPRAELLAGFALPCPGPQACNRSAQLAGVNCHSSFTLQSASRDPGVTVKAREIPNSWGHGGVVPPPLGDAHGTCYLLNKPSISSPSISQGTCQDSGSVMIRVRAGGAVGKSGGVDLAMPAWELLRHLVHSDPKTARTARVLALIQTSC